MDRRDEDVVPAGPASWNARRGSVWADLQVMLDGLFLPFERVLTDAVAAEAATEVLDVGCGAGATTLAAARCLAPGGRCTGLDVSGALIEVARRRATAAGVANARFVVGDAQRYAFVPDTFDAVVSRFGIMFFDEPETAFANIRRGARGGAGLTCIVWRGPDDNPFMTAAERAVAPLLKLEGPERDAPGQFAFADADRVRRILKAGGWGGIDVRALDVPCRLTEAELVVYAHRMGRVGMVLPDLDEARREAIEAALDRAFAPYLSGGAARFDAACWLIRARAD